jgi:hypothetical protein
MCMTEFQKQDSETSSQSFAAKFRIIKQNSEILYVMFCESHKVIYIVYSLLGIQNQSKWRPGIVGTICPQTIFGIAQNTVIKMSRI